MARSILIVDDEEGIRETVELLLEDEGYEIVKADGGDACLKTLESGFRGVILMDIMMPGMNGWDTIHEIVNRGLINGNAICMLTAVGDPPPRMAGLAEYVLDYVRKPFIVQRLIEAIEDGLMMCGEAQSV